MYKVKPIKDAYLLLSIAVLLLGIGICACAGDTSVQPQQVATDDPLHATLPTSITQASDPRIILFETNDEFTSRSILLRPDMTPYAASLLPANLGDLENFSASTRYDIDFTILPDLHTVVGKQITRYVNRSGDDLTELMLRLYPNTAYMDGAMRIEEAQVDDQPVHPALYQRLEYSSVMTETHFVLDSSVISLPLSTPLHPGQTAVVALTYTLTIPPHANGGYRTFGWANEILALPDAYAMIPVHDQSGWRIDAAPDYGDIVYAETGLYRVRIHAPADLSIVATGICASRPDTMATTLERAGAWMETACAAAPARDFAIHASRRYEVVTATVNTKAGTVLISSYFIPPYQRGGRLALQYARAALQVYERRFGAYPYRELKVFPSATTAGGIEYPMVAGVTDSLYATEGGYFEWIVAHEVAHQWWYGMVGSDPIHEAWLDESLAQYSASLYIEDQYGAAAAVAARDLYFIARYRSELDNGRDAAVAQSTGAFERTLYAPMVYGKGPLFFDAVRRGVGDRLFDAWLRNYFNRYRYRIAHGNDLLNTADENAIGTAARSSYEEWMVGSLHP